jgi:hypothetical protein
MECHSALGLGVGLTILHLNSRVFFSSKFYTGSLMLTDSLARPKQWKMDMRFCTWNLRSLCRAGSLRTTTSGLEKWLGLVGV